MASPQLYTSVQALVDAMPRGRRLLGLDIGEKTIGLAISDPGFMIASPVTTLARARKFAPTVKELRRVIADEDVGGLVAGLPVSMDGTEGPRCQASRDLTLELTRQLGLPATFWDERLSTAAIQRFLIDEADMNRKRRGEVVDKMAAAYILQGALDSLTGPLR